MDNDGPTMMENRQSYMRRRRSSEAVGLEIDGGRVGGGGGHSPSVGIDVRGDRSPSIGGAGDKSLEPRPSARLQGHRRFYMMHTACVVLVLLLGIAHNGGKRKYIPVNPKDFSYLAEDMTSEMHSCHKAYVNVHSSSIEDEYSFICCSAGNTSRSNIGEWQSWHQSNLCDPQIPMIGVSTQQLPFARRLTRLKEAWVLPLLPILIRLVYQLIMFMYTWSSLSKSEKDQGVSAFLQREATSLSSAQSSSSSSSLSSNTSTALLEKQNVNDASSGSHPHASLFSALRTTLLRFAFYFLLLNLRGWGLYIGANAVEDYIILPWLTGNTVISPLRTDSMSDVEHDLQYSGNEPSCWYKDVLKAHHKSAMENSEHSDCYGRPFDFSDHVVLFLAHYLPVFVMEIIICYSVHFWGPSGAAMKQQMPSARMIWNVFYGFLFLYLHLIVLHALYQTAVYFHTPAEILVGYGVSLFLQLPVLYLMCSEGSSGVRRYLGLPEGGVMSEKGD